MNRNKSVSSMNSHEGTGLGGGLTQLGTKSIAAPIMLGNTASALAVQSARSTSLIQSDRASLIRPMSAQSPDAMKFKKRDLSGGKAQQDLLENTNSDGGDSSFMDTQKQLIIPSSSAMDNKLSPSKLKSIEMESLIVNTGNNSNNGKKSQLMNNFMPPTSSSSNLLSVSPQKIPHSDSTTNVGIINSALETSTMSAHGGANLGNGLIGTTSQHLVTMEEVKDDKELKDENALKAHLLGHVGVSVYRIKVIGEPMIKNLCSVIQSSNIEHLRFEETRIHRKGILALQEHLKFSKLKSIALVAVRYEDWRDFRDLIEGIIKCPSIRQVIFNNMTFSESNLLEPFKKLVTETRQLQELDLSQCTFKSPKLSSGFFPVLANSKVWRFIMRETVIGPFENLLMKAFFLTSQSVRYIDISQCIGAQKNFDFIAQLGSLCSIKELIMEELQVDISPHMPQIGKALGANLKLQVLDMTRNNKVQLDPNSSKVGQSWYDAQVQFWKSLMPNRSIQVMILEDTKIKYQTCECIAEYLKQYNIKVTELNLRKNQIGRKGVKFLAEALRINTSLKILRLSYNNLGCEDGITELQEALCENDTLEELYLDQNNLENFGTDFLGNFLVQNSTLRILDISKNNIGSYGLERFSEKLALNLGLRTLYLTRNKDIFTEGDEGIRALGICLSVNRSLKVLDMDGIQQINRKRQEDFFLQNLQKNIFLQEFKIKNALDVKLSDQLHDNKEIENEIINKQKLRKDGSILVLDLQYEKPTLVRPAIKLIEYLHIIQVDFQAMTLSDDQLELISLYLEKNLSLRRLDLSHNCYFTDWGMIRMTQALAQNDKLEKLTFNECIRLTIKPLEQMLALVKYINTTLWDISTERVEGSNYAEKSRLLVEEARLNQNILQVLKPNPAKSQPQRIKEVKFDSNARIAQCFESALKCWRILRPLGIDVCDQDLEDQHIKLLSQLLKKEMKLIETLTLRRNKIKDDGLIALSEFIKDNPPCFTYLEISRNEITDKGAIELLKALKSNTRITTLLLEYGNQIKNKEVLRQIDQEIFANKLIGDEVRNSLVPEHDNFGKLRINDKGPTYLRGAIKAIEIFNLIELNLSDNLLEYEQAIMIAEMIALDTHLKVLNLSKNRFDENSARVFARAIVFNKHLYEIDLSSNRLRDEGIAIFIYPFAYQALCKNIFEALLADPNTVRKPIRWLFNKGEVEIQVKVLNLTKNKHKEESLKHVLALLYANKEIFVDIDIPKKLQHKLQQQLGLEEMKKSNEGGGIHANISGGGEEIINNKKNQEADESKVEQKKNWRDLIGRFGPAINYNRQTASPRKLYHQVQTGPTVEQQIAQQKAEKEAKEKEEKEAKEAKKNKKKRGRAVANKKKAKNAVTPGEGNQDGGENNDLEGGRKDEESIAKQKQAAEQKKLEEEKKKQCCYRCREQCKKSEEQKKQPFFLRRLKTMYDEEKKFARLFKCNEKILTDVENVSQKYISVWIYISTIFFYITALLIPLTEEDSCKNGHDRKLLYFYGIYAVCSGIMELLLSFYIQKVVNNPKLFKVTKFHIWKLVSGHLARFDFFNDVLFLTQMYWCGLFGIVAAGTAVLVLSGAYQFLMPFRLLKTQEGNLLKYIDRNCKLAYVTEHGGIAIILDSFSLSNFETINGQTVSIPKIISMIKCYTEDLPQFVIQIVYILFFSDKKNDSSGVVISILLGLVSFASSISTAIFAKSSDVDLLTMIEYQEKRRQERELKTEIDRKEFFQEGYTRILEFCKDQQDKKNKTLNENNEQKHLQNFGIELLNIVSDKTKLNKDGTIPKQALGTSGKRSMSSYKKQVFAEDLDTSVFPVEVNKSPDTSNANLLQKTSNNNAQKKPKPDSVATSPSETADKGNKKDLITEDNKQLNIKESLQPTNQGLSPTQNSKGKGAGSNNAI